MTSTRTESSAAPASEDILAFLESSTEMDAFARRVGETEIHFHTKDGPVTHKLRPLTASAQMAVDRAIPGVAPDDPERAAKLAARAVALTAGEVAVCLNIAVPGEQGSDRTFDRPGRGERRVLLPVYIRDAARHVLSHFTAEEMGRILSAAADAADPIALTESAGKDSAPSSTTSGRKPKNGANPDPEESPTTSPSGAAPGTAS